jgi:hypothetical protein
MKSTSSIYMNKARSVFIALLFASSATFAANAGADQIQGNSHYRKLWRDSRPNFYDLEQLGVRKAAEDDAVQNCRQSGYSHCYPVSSQISSCNYSGGVDEGAAVIHCEGTAVAVGWN